jgi:hypothetical protein
MSGWQADFFNTFSPSDTLIGADIYANKFPALLKDLSSADSNRKYAANQSLESLSFEKIYVDDFIRYMQDSAAFAGLTENAQATLLVRGGTMESDKIIPLYKKLYKRFTDNSYLQVCLLKGLGYLKTATAYKAMADLLKEEVPLVGDESIVTSYFEPMYDSLELAKTLFPDLLNTTRFEEYKMPVYRLLGKLVEKGLVNQSVYLPHKATLLKEANYELKRFNASNSSAMSGNANANSLEDMAKAEAEKAAQAIANSIGKRSFGNAEDENERSMLENFSIMLAPFYTTDAGVKNYFDKQAKIKNEKIMLEISLISLKNKIPVNDTIWRFYSENTASRVLLYKKLDKLKESARFDKKYLSQENFCKATILSQIQYNEYSYDYDADREIGKKQTDTISFIKKTEACNKYDKGYIYFFRRHGIKNNDKKMLAWVFVRNSKDELSTDIEALETKFVVDEGEKEEEIMNDAVTNFYTRYRSRCAADYRGD